MNVNSKGRRRRGRGPRGGRGGVREKGRGRRMMAIVVVDVLE